MNKMVNLQKRKKKKAHENAIEKKKQRVFSGVSRECI